MDAKELMIDDWVLIDEPDKYAGAKAQIKTLIFHKENDGQYFSVFIHDRLGIVRREVFNEDLRPIPLTREILEKNGFTDGKYRHYTGCIWKLNVEGFRILNLTKSCGKSCLWGEKIKPNCPNSVGNEFAIPNICYVHELQHAMRLLDINLKIEL